MADYSEFLERLRAEVDIVSLVSDYVNLRRSGKNFVGLCPFHQEKTPSFTVSPERRMFYCFGCHAGGDAISFLMKIEKLTFPEAVEALARKLGIKVPQVSEEAKEQKDLLFKVNELACSFFEKCLHGPSGIKAKEYLLKRGVKEETQRVFRLGYAPESGELSEFLKNKGINLELLFKAGLVTEKGGKELFRNRLIFPIMDLRGRVIAFGGRALDDSLPKYLNSGQTPLFEKGRHLYAIHLAKKSVSEIGNAIVVEGYIDAISCHQEGFQNVVASLGTALTRDQVALLSRFAKKVILAYDADIAGVMATIRSFELFGQMDMEVRVASLEGFKDPDELLKNRKSAGLSRAISSSIPALDFAYEKIRQRYDWKVPQERKEGVLEILNLISTIDSPLDQEKYIKRLALDSGYGEDTLFLQLRKKEKPTTQKQARERPLGFEEMERIKAKLPAAEEACLKLLFEEPQLMALAERELNPEDFSHPQLKIFFQKALERFKKGEEDLYNINFETPEDVSLLARLLMESHPGSEDPEKELKQCILKIKRDRLTRDQKRLSQEISALERSGDTELYRKKLEELQILVNKIRSLTVK
ncbi:MAG: DNA primase [Caldiserica bacterium]|jgi:DNA primase|nr:DNA primase [Caldisericota bacterium]MDH7561928.1 DNA primase [Caldisericota bacterium]